MFNLPSLYRYRWRWPIGISLLFYIIVMYGVPGNFPVLTPIPVPATLIDRLVPFDPHWVWIYASYYFMLIFAFFSVRNDRAADLYIWGLGFAAILGTICFFAYPTEISRTPYALIEPYGLSERLLWLIRLADRDLNCAPSMHVAMSIVATAAFCRVSKRVGWFAFFWLLAIIYSVMATKQHFAIDVVTGAIVGIAALEIVRRCRVDSDPTRFAAV